jgi:hypothetical protein
MINQISHAGGTRTPTRNDRRRLTEVPARALGRVPDHMAEDGAGNFKQERTFRRLGSERNVLSQMETAIPRDRLDSEVNDIGPDPSPLEIQLRAARIRAGWTEGERQIRPAQRTQRIALQFKRFIQLIGQRQSEEGRN